MNQEIIFTFKFWLSFCFYLDIRQKLSTVFHSQTDEQTEWQNQTMKVYLRIYCNETQDNWARLLYIAEFLYNNSQHTTTEITFFFINEECHSKLKFSVLRRLSETLSATEHEQIMKSLDKSLRGRIKKLNQQYTEYYDSKYIFKKYSVGDKVWLDIRNIQIYLLNKKLDSKRFSSFQIIDKFEKQTYKLDISMSHHIHSVFNVLLLESFKKLFKYADQSQDDGFKRLKILIWIFSELEYEVEELLNSKKNYNVLYYLVKWKGYNEFNNTWKSVENLQHLVTKLKTFHKAFSTKLGTKINTAKQSAN